MFVIYVQWSMETCSIFLKTWSPVFTPAHFDVTAAFKIVSFICLHHDTVCILVICVFQYSLLFCGPILSFVPGASMLWCALQTIFYILLLLTSPIKRPKPAIRQSVSQSSFPRLSVAVRPKPVYSYWRTKPFEMVQKYILMLLKRLNDFLK